MLLIAVIVSFIVLKPMGRSLFEYWRHRQRHRLLLGATPLTSASRPGDRVKFVGRLGHPVGKTPFGGRRAGYFRSILRAAFKTKRRKPEKGTQTHRPVLHLESSEDEPMLMTCESGELIHLCFSKPWDQFEELRTKTKVLIKLPSKFAHLDKRKYESYDCIEWWYAPQDQLFALATIIDRTRLGYVVGPADLKDEAQLLSRKNETELLAEASSGVSSALVALISYLAVLGATWGIYFYVLYIQNR